jgi:hypothetical protein
MENISKIRLRKGFRQTRRLCRTKSPSIEDGSKIVNKRNQLGHLEDGYLDYKQSEICIKSVNKRNSVMVY